MPSALLRAVLVPLLTGCVPAWTTSTQAANPDAPVVLHVLAVGQSTVPFRSIESYPVAER